MGFRVREGQGEGDAGPDLALAVGPHAAPGRPERCGIYAAAA